MFILRHTTVRLYMMQHNMTSGIGHPAPDNLHPYNNSPRYRANPFAWYSTNMSPLRGSTDDMIIHIYKHVAPTGL